MHHPFVRALVAAVALVVGRGAARAEEGGAKVARAALTAAPPVIDGRLDEAVWAAAPTSEDFVERSPTLRGAPAERTSFRLLADGAALYVAVTCHDSQPGAIRARTLQRDSTALFDDDAVSVKIDPLRDRRTTYGFALNAAGGRIDYRGVNDGTWQIEVDLVWDGAAVTTADGWTAELRIPWTTLGIDPSSPPVVSGFDVSRDVSRLHATYDWALIAPPHEAIAASQYGALAGLPELLHGVAPSAARKSWALLPWALAGYDDPSAGALEPIGNAGLDVEADLGNGFDATLTLNTDFAQVEVDDVQSNLDRFDLFLPEKRDFFLKDGDLFAFGEEGWASLFHSRTIGLVAPDEATELPILAGLKLGGRSAGGFRLGALSVLTRPAHDVPWRLDSVVRLQQSFSSGSSVGMMSTLRQSLEDADLHNLNVGFDGRLSPHDSPLLVKTFVATSIDGAPGRADVVDGAAHIDASWRGELVRPRVGYAYFGPSMRSALGYFERTGIHDIYADVSVVPRLGGGLKTLTLQTVDELVLSAPGADRLDWETSLGAELEWDSGTWAGVYGRLGQLTVESFTVGGDHTIAAGVHDNDRIEVAAGTPSTEVVSLEGSVVYRQYFGGRALALSGTLVAKPGTWLRAVLDASDVFVSLPSGDFAAPNLNLRLSSGLTTDLELSAFAGWSGLEHTVSLQTRLRWTFAPGDDLFAVWELRLDDDTGQAQHHSFIAKIALRWP
ncbi:MAG: DUF5916 domain-containing protein [Myxococcota bacterium]